MAKESHYGSKKDRVFVRGVQGQYSLKDELARLRAQPRVIKGHGRTQKHGHVNEAAFYILDGTGYEIHDGIRYDWKAGDVAVVHNNCVHQHFNADPAKPARALVIKTKPMYMFMNMLFQKSVIPRPTEPTAGGVGFEPRHAETDYNHPSE
jgi:quercetin dioxygenase-like cupin family protein